LTSTSTQGVDLDGNGDVDSTMDVERGPRTSARILIEEGFNVEVDGGVYVQRRRRRSG
jgi:hypothetical protein